MTQAEQLAAQAAQWQAAGRFDMAAQLYAAAIDQDPTKFALRMQLAECMVALGQTEQAAEQYLMVAQAYAARGRHQECLAICERVLVVAPHAFVYMSVGPMVRRIGRAARPICARAAEAHLAAGRQTDGLQILRLGAELDPHNPEVRRQLARIYQARHMKREAVEALLDAGNLLLQAKRWDDYVQVAEQILALEPRELETLRDLPRVYLELRRPHDAVRMLGLLTKASPGDIVGYEILAQAFAVIGRVDKSLSVLERLIDELGATGRADKANSILNHARHWRPTDLGFLRSLKRMEIARPTPQAERPPAARPAGAEGTVVLSIADLLVDEVSKRAAAPGKGAVKLTEAEGTLTLRLDDLILDEMQQAAGKGVAPTKPPPGSPPPPPARGRRAPPPSPRRTVEAPPPRPPAKAKVSVDATMALDAADLIEALTGELPRRAARPSPGPARAMERPDETELLTTDHAHALPRLPATVPPAMEAARRPEPADEETTTAPPSGRPAVAPASRSMSELIYDDDDGDPDAEARDARRDARWQEEEEAQEAEDSETLLHMRPLTAQDIERALARQAAKAAPQAPPPQAVPAPYGPPQAVPAPQAVPPPQAVPAPQAWVTPPSLLVPPPTIALGDDDLDAPTLPPASVPRAATHDELDAPTIMASAAAKHDDFDAPTMVPASARRGGMEDEAHTVAKLSPLAAADIARALSQRIPTRPPPAPVNEEAATLPPPSSRVPARAQPPEPPQEPPPLPPLLLSGRPAMPNAHDDPDDDDDELDGRTISMTALRPEDLLRGPTGGPRGGGSGRS